MNWKQRIKRITPRGIHRLYNRVVSRRIIGRIYGDWFDLDWKRKAAAADDRTWLATYDRSWEHWEQEDLSPQDVERICGLIGKGESVLDAGCGNGYLLAALAAKSGKPTGVDLSGTGLSLAYRRLGSTVHLAQAFLERLPFSDQSFNVVVSAHTLEHVRDLKRAIAEIIRVAEKRIIILVPSQEYLPYTQDYHLHFFPNEEDLLHVVNIPGARCERWTVPPDVCAFQGDVLLLTAELKRERT
ncbi:class I SAM-dependent methyltransferase [candidate division KSB1 bacterium]|nr:MAG: class I SAM-dependent methyltransferase [candidate division KSB1 bacterium]